MSALSTERGGGDNLKDCAHRLDVTANLEKKKWAKRSQMASARQARAVALSRMVV